MAALFYTNHKMVDVQSMFKEWVALWKKNKNGPKKLRAVPAIEIDTELANAQYENANEIENIEQIGNHLNEDSEVEMEDMIRIEGDEEASSEKEEEESESQEP